MGSFLGLPGSGLPGFNLNLSEDSYACDAGGGLHATRGWIDGVGPGIRSRHQVGPGVGKPFADTR
jgi:hypothetical protein